MHVDRPRFIRHSSRMAADRACWKSTRGVAAARTSSAPICSSSTWILVRIVPWKRVNRSGANVLKQTRASRCTFPTFLKTSGGKGLHHDDPDRAHRGLGLGEVLLCKTIAHSLGGKVRSVRREHAQETCAAGKVYRGLQPQWAQRDGRRALFHARPRRRADRDADRHGKSLAETEVGGPFHGRERWEVSQQKRKERSMAATSKNRASICLKVIADKNPQLEEQ
jgi:hypothetical protein